MLHVVISQCLYYKAAQYDAKAVPAVESVSAINAILLKLNSTLLLILLKLSLKLNVVQ